MEKNTESLAPTINGQTVQTDEEVIGDCFISKQTFEFLSCVLALHDLYGKVENALIKMYGVEQLDEAMGGFNLKCKELEYELYGLVNNSINENISVISFNKI